MAQAAEKQTSFRKSVQDESKCGVLGQLLTEADKKLSKFGDRTQQ